MGRVVRGRWEQRLGPHGTRHLRDQIDDNFRRWRGRRGTGRTDRWRYQLRESIAEWVDEEHDSYFALEPNLTQIRLPEPEPCNEPEQELDTWEEQFALRNLKQEKRRAQKVWPGPIMPTNYKPLRKTYSFGGPPPGVGLRRRTDNMDMVEGRLTDREVDSHDIPADNIRQEILRGIRETSGRRLPRHDRELRTEEDQFPYRNPITATLASKEKTVDRDWKQWYERDDKRREFLQRKARHDRRIQEIRSSGVEAGEHIRF